MRKVRSCIAIEKVKDQEWDTIWGSNVSHYIILSLKMFIEVRQRNGVASQGRQTLGCHRLHRITSQWARFTKGSQREIDGSNSLTLQIYAVTDEEVEIWNEWRAMIYSLLYIETLIYLIRIKIS